MPKPMRFRPPVIGYSPDSLLCTGLRLYGGDGMFFCSEHFSIFYQASRNHAHNVALSNMARCADNQAAPRVEAIMSNLPIIKCPAG
jgi:hypothetical protein